MQRAAPYAFLVSLVCLFASHAHAAAPADRYPNKTIRYVIPFPPGGITDLMARTIAQKTSDAWKQSVVIDNRPGANALLGADLVAKSTPDGYTWLGMTITHTVNATLIANPPYNFSKDLTAVTVLGSLPLVTVVPQSLPVKSLAELTALSRTRALNGGSSGNGTPQHLAFELYRQLSGANATHIPFKGGGPSTIALLGGHVDFITTGLPECLPHIKSGRLRPLTVAGPSRLPPIPDVPTTAELGMPSLVITSWTGLMVPSSTPKEIVARINAEVVNVLKQPDVAERVREQGFDVVANSPTEAQAFMASEVARWGKLVREANIKAD
jgi:tripartite-type tricarboxylate transporter receptor subunit TctC